MVDTWDDNNEETSDDDVQEMSNVTLMAIGDKLFDKLNEVSDSTYDEL